MQFMLVSTWTKNIGSSANKNHAIAYNQCLPEYDSVCDGMTFYYVYFLTILSLV